MFIYRHLDRLFDITADEADALQAVGYQSPPFPEEAV
jgi:hypothetical protein